MDQRTIELLFGGKGSQPSADTRTTVEASGEITPPRETGNVPLDVLAGQGAPKAEPTAGTTAVAPFVGFNQGLTAIGMPVDIINWGLKQVGLPASEKPFMGSEFIREMLPQKIEPRNALERSLQAGGEGVAYALIPQAGVEIAGMRAATPLIKAPPTGVTLGETAQKVFGARRPGSVASTAENVAINLGAGMGAQAAGELAEGKAYKPIAEMAGGIGGGGLTQLVTEGAKQVPKLFTGLYHYLEPALGEAGQKRAAARQFAAGTSSPLRAIDVIENEPRTLIEGSQPTTFEMTGDVGIGQQQRRAETKMPEMFIDRQGEQAVAREAALQGVAPEGAPMAVASTLRQQLDEFDRIEMEAAQRAQERVSSAIDRMGGNVTAEDAGRMMREALQAAKDVAKAARTKLYNAIDPNKELNVVATGLRDAAKSVIAESADPLAKPLEGELRAIVNDAAKVDDVVKFNSLRSLDTRISDAMRTELMTNGETNTYRQLKMMKDGVMDAINNSVENQKRFEADAVAAGGMRPEDTLEERLRGMWGIMGREPVEPKPQLQPNLTPEDIAALEAAKTAQKQYAGTFREGPVGEALRPGKSQGEYKLQFDAQVGPKFFRPGEAGNQAMEGFMQAAKDQPQAIDAMREYITSSMMKETRDPQTGLLDPKKFDAWRKKHESALRAMPELADQFSNAAKASDSAAQIMAGARARIEAAQKSEVAKIMGATDDATVTQMVGEIFGKKNAAQTMRQLAQAASANPDAKAGLQKAVADYIRGRFISTTEAGASEANLIKSAQFQNFVRQNRRTLEQVFDKDQVNVMQALADDLHRSNRSLSGTALRGRSTTAQDLPAATEKAQSAWASFAKMTGPIVTGLAGQQLTGTVTGALAGFAGGTVAAIAQSMRSAGMQNVDQLITEALLNPELARDLLRMAPSKATPASTRTLSENIANTLITGAKQPIQQEELPPLTINRQGRATGGAVNLMALSKAAKKQVTKVTEPLLNEHDDTVARALEVANKHI